MNEIGIKDQCFGIEDEMTGITREKAAAALGSYFGARPAHIGDTYDRWTVRDQEGKEWCLVSDGSIRVERKRGSRYERGGGSEYRVELVSPKLTYGEIPKLQEVIRTLRKAGAVVNDSCGLHIHIDAANHNRQSLKNLLSIMFSKEDILFKALQVNESRIHSYCKRVREPMLQKARRLSGEETTDLTRLENIWYEDFDSRDSRNTHYNASRYYALNLHSVFYRGTVEFRLFNATLHAGIVKAYVHLCLAMSAQAIRQRSTVMRRTQSENEAFTFRVWLVRMGLNGDEFKNTRKHLLDHLEGDKAWRYDKESYPANQKKKIKKQMER